MAYRQDFSWTQADRDAGFPGLKAHVAATATDTLQATYLANMRDCLGSHNLFRHNLCVVQRHVAQELLARGVTHIPNLFGPIAVTAQWQTPQQGDAAVP